MVPKLACCNFIADPNDLKGFALDQDFQGIDWSFTPDNLPGTAAEESSLVRTIQRFHPLEIRYHCAFRRVDLGNNDETKARQAFAALSRLCRLVSKLDGKFLTIHVGLGRNTTQRLSWDRTVNKLAELVSFADNLGICLCLENLAWGWTSRPELFEKLVRKSGCGVTVDIGHARVSPSIVSQLYETIDFISPHPDRIFNVHVYNTEKDDVHLPPAGLNDLYARLQLTSNLPLCDWWVLELREEQALRKTHSVVREFLQQKGTERELRAVKEYALSAF